MRYSALEVDGVAEWLLRRKFYDRLWPYAVIEISPSQSFDFSCYRRDGTDVSLAAMLQSVSTSAKSLEKSLKPTRLVNHAGVYTNYHFRLREGRLLSDTLAITPLSTYLIAQYNQ